MKLINHGDVPVYAIAGSSSARPLPEYLAKKRRRSLKKDPDWANRIELLQNFDFEDASQCVRVSEDGDWVMSTGTYKPQIHTHYAPHLSLSYTRHTSSLNTTFILLTSDASKSVHLQDDRSLDFHTRAERHHTMRLPRYGRDLKYDRRTAETLIPAVGVNENGKGEVFRVNLSLGRHMKPYEVEVGGDDLSSAGGGSLQGGVATGAVNAAALAEDSHDLLAFGTSLGTVEFWDSRSSRRAGIVQPPEKLDIIDGKYEITALEFDRSGLGIAAGSSTGLIHLYDLRSPKPLLKKDQGYGYPIQNLIYLTSSTSSRAQATEPKILSTDKRIIKIWDPQNGDPWTSVQPAVDLNCVAWCKDSGMLLTANEGKQQHCFLIPQLGPAPKWCSFLDNLVEEMAEDPNDPSSYSSQQAGQVYDNHKFLTMQQLESLNLSHLIGTTSLLRPYMHGYFVAKRLYEEAKLIAEPRVWEGERDKRLKDKIASEREGRIRGDKKAAVKVNKQLAQKVLRRQEKEERRKEERRKAKKAVDQENGDYVAGSSSDDVQPSAEEEKGILSDPRFAKLFQDPEFEIDETSKEFQMLNPSTKPTVRESKPSDQKPPERKLTAVEEEALDDAGGSSSDTDSSSEEGSSIRVQDTGRISSSSYKKSGHRPQQPQVRISSSRAPQRKKDKSFGDRVEHSKTSKQSNGTVVGEREMTFAPARKSKEGERKQNPPARQGGRRSASGNVFRSL
ncbi:MAG: hypothetical protein Q9222_002509 [Ikaeria aurantiellina]